ERDFIEQSAVQLDRSTMAGRVALDLETVYIADVLEDRDLRTDVLSGINFRTGLGVPLLRKGELVGLLLLSREEQQPFSRRQIELVETFADQAVIAIENTRLFEAEQASKRDLTEALEQQTATADVLKVISRSALDVQKVLDALVESAARLCDAYDAVIFQVFGDGLRLVAHHGQIPTGGPVGQHTIPLVRGRITGRGVIGGRTIQGGDILGEGGNALQRGWRTALAVPLVHAGPNTPSRAWSKRYERPPSHSPRTRSSRSRRPWTSRSRLASATNSASRKFCSTSLATPLSSPMLAR